MAFLQMRKLCNLVQSLMNSDLNTEFSGAKAVFLLPILPTCSLLKVRALGTQEDVSQHSWVQVEQPVWFCYWNVARVEVGHVQAFPQKSQMTFRVVFSQLVKPEIKIFRWWYHLGDNCPEVARLLCELAFDSVRVARP